VENDRLHARAKDAPAFFTHEVCRLFRRRSDIFFTGRVHEMVEPQIARAGLKLGLADFFIHHFGHLESTAEKDVKGTYYRDLLRRKVEEEPDDPGAWVQLALQEYECFHNQTEALRCLQRALHLEPRAAEAWLFLAMIYVDAGRFEDALAALEHDVRKGASVALKEQVRGDALHSLNRLDQARTAYRRSIKIAGCDPVLESKLGYVEVKLGHRDPGLTRLLNAAQQAPGMFAVQDRLMKAYIIVGNLPEAASTADKLATSSPHPKLFLRAASLYAALPDRNRCLRILQLGLDTFPDSTELSQAFAEANKELAACAKASSASSLAGP